MDHGWQSGATNLASGLGLSCEQELAHRALLASLACPSLPTPQTQTLMLNTTSTYGLFRALLVMSCFGMALLAPALVSAQDTPTPGTWYLLKSMSYEDAECLESNGRGGQFGGNSVMTPCRSQSGQLWQVEDAGNGYYRLKSSERGEAECFESNGRNVDYMGGSAYMDDCQDVSGQYWQFESADNGHYRLKSMFRGANECLEANGRGSEYMGGTAFMDDCKNVTGQLWRFDTQGSVGGAASSNETMIIDGTEVQTGALQVTLQWDSRADLDLYVTDPAGGTVSYQNTSVPSGGTLDVDARSGCSATDATVENIIWSSTPPSGSYDIKVNYYTSCDEGPVPYTVTLRRAGQVVETWTGTAEFGNTSAHSYTAR